MSFTKDYSVADDTWTLVANTDPGVLVQLKSTGPVIIHVAPVQPFNTVYDGIILDRGALEEISVSPMEVGDAIYVRAKTPDKTEIVGVIGSGVAPDVEEEEAESPPVL